MEITKNMTDLSWLEIQRVFAVPRVDWHFNVGLRIVQRILVTPCEILEPAVSIEKLRQYVSFLGRS